MKVMDDRWKMLTQSSVEGAKLFLLMWRTPSSSGARQKAEQCRRSWARGAAVAAVEAVDATAAVTVVGVVVRSPSGAAGSMPETCSGGCQLRSSRRRISRVIPSTAGDRTVTAGCTEYIAEMKIITFVNGKRRQAKAEESVIKLLSIYELFSLSANHSRVSFILLEIRRFH